MKINYLLFVIILFLWGSTNAQTASDTSKTKKYTPYDLLSNYYNEEFKPFKKRNVYIGSSLSLEDRQMENTENIFQKVIEGNKVSFNLLLKGGYFLNDYSMVGLDFNIYENKSELTLYSDPDTVQSNSIKRGFSFTPQYRTSIPLTQNERLSFFTSAGLTLGRSNSLKRETKNLDEVTKKFIENYNLRLGVSPGVTFFAMENFAMEVQIDVLGYEFNYEKTTKNDLDPSVDFRHNVDFKINILSVKVGVAYYINNKKNR